MPAHDGCSSDAEYKGPDPIDLDHDLVAGLYRYRSSKSTGQDQTPGRKGPAPFGQFANEPGHRSGRMIEHGGAGGCGDQLAILGEHATHRS